MRRVGSTLRLRFALSAAALTLVVVALFALGAYLHIRAENFEEVDLELAAEADHLSRLAETGKLVAEASYQPWIRFILFGADDAAPLVSEEWGAGQVPVGLDTNPGPVPGTVRGASGAWRTLSRATPAGRLLVAYDLSEVDEIQAELLGVFLGGSLLVIPLAALGGWLLAGRVLAPVARLSRAAEAIDIHALDQRVPVPATDDELQRLALRLNAMLERLEAGVAQARRFTADASHELRTPLTIMRGELDRLLHSGGLSAEQESRLLGLQEATGRLQRITETLLLLARLDAGAGRDFFAPFDLTELVRETQEDASLLAEDASVTLAFSLTPGLRIAGDADQVRRMVLNLLDNAIRHNHRGGRVDCALDANGAWAELRVRNTGPGLPEELRSRLFQRFARGDPSRAAGANGLGLALAREIARSHGGDIELGSAPGAELTEFRVRLPRLTAGAVS